MAAPSPSATVRTAAFGLASKDYGRLRPAPQDEAILNTAGASVRRPRPGCRSRNAHRATADPRPQGACGRAGRPASHHARRTPSPTPTSGPAPRNRSRCPTRTWTHGDRRLRLALARHRPGRPRDHPRPALQPGSPAAGGRADGRASSETASTAPSTGWTASPSRRPSADTGSGRDANSPVLRPSGFGQGSAGNLGLDEVSDRGNAVIAQLLHTDVAEDADGIRRGGRPLNTAA